MTPILSYVVSKQLTGIKLTRKNIKWVAIFKESLPLTIFYIRCIVMCIKKEPNPCPGVAGYKPYITSMIMCGTFTAKKETP